MREYGQIQSSYWTHPDIQSLSTETKLIGAYLLTCQHANGLGCFRMPFGYISIDLSMGIETVKEGFKELSRNGFLEWCDRTEFVLIPEFLRWNPVQNPNSAKARVKEFESIPSKSGIYPSLINALQRYSKYFDDEFLSNIETLSKRFANGSETVPHAIRDKKTLPYPDNNIVASDDGDFTDEQYVEEKYDFDFFYEKYPVKKSKQQAIKAWKRLKHQDRIDAVELINKFVSTVPSGIALPHPSTYLNNRRWEDEPVTADDNGYGALL